VIGIDGGPEFKGSVRTYFKDNNMTVKLSMPYRHKQQVWVENANKYIGKLIFMFLNKQQIATGREYNKWIHILPEVVEALNDKMVKLPPLKHEERAIATGKDVPKLLDKFIDKIDSGETIPIISKGIARGSKISAQTLDEGTKVRVKLEAPESVIDGSKLSGKFRASDIKWERKTSKITGLALNPNQPPLYKVSGHERAVYSKNELQPVKSSDILNVKDVEPSSHYIIEKILAHRIRNKKIEYKIKWEHYSDPDSYTWESKESLLTDAGTKVKKLIKDYDNAHAL
jgi:hypothetical protein